MGAGLAGLSLAVHLVESGVDAEIELLDRRTDFPHDRTWCGFATARHRFASCVQHRWHQVEVRDAKQAVRVRLHAHPYEHVPARAFYDEALRVLRAAPNVRLRLGTDVRGVGEADGLSPGQLVAGDVRERFDHIFDSRPPTGVSGEGLWQGFVGTVVRTEVNAFDPRTAHLMDFAMDGTFDQRAGEVAFRYVLPFDAQTALVEETVFTSSRDAAHPAALGQRLARWRRNLPPHVCLREESGVLPMFDWRAPATARCTPIGLRAGAAKAASGYAFAFVQRHSEALVRDRHASVPRGDRARWLDRILLRELRRNPSIGPRLFRRLFARNNGDRVARFMMEDASLADDLAIMASVPSTRLIRGGVLAALRRN